MVKLVSLAYRSRGPARCEAMEGSSFILTVFSCYRPGSLVLNLSFLYFLFLSLSLSLSFRYLLTRCFFPVCWIGRTGRPNGPHRVQQQGPAVELRPADHAEQQGRPQAGGGSTLLTSVFSITHSHCHQAVSEESIFKSRGFLFQLRLSLM